MNREAIYTALFDRLKAAASFQTASRRLRHWNDVPSAEQPALFLAQRTESCATVPGLNNVWTLKADVYIYARTGDDKSTPPGSLINPLLDAIAARLAPDPITNKQRLGGLVEHAWIEGEIQTDEGVLGDQGVCIVPIILKVTD